MAAEYSTTTSPLKSRSKHAGDLSGSLLLRLVLLFLVFYLVALHYLRSIPPMEGPDEAQHFGYVTQLRETGQLPNPEQFEQNLAGHESAQPPLYYSLVALWSRLGPDYEWSGDLPPNVWSYAASDLPGDNRNFYLLGDLQMPVLNAVQDSLWWDRLLSPFLGLLALTAAWRAARLILQPRWAMLTAILFGFNPVTIQAFALLGNDAAAVCLGAFSVWAVLSLLVRPPTLRRLLLAGMLLAFAGLAKSSLLIYWPLAGLALWLQSSRTIRQRISASVLLALPPLLIAGPWYLRGLLLYDDPLGSAPHLAMPWAFQPMRDILVALGAELPLIPSVWQGFGAAYVRVAPGNWADVLMVVISIIGLAGVLTAMLRGGLLRQRTIWLLLLICVGMMLAYFRWAQHFTAVGGRLILPGYLAFTLLLSIGLRAGWREPARSALRGFAAIGVIFLAVTNGWLTLPRAYGVFLGLPEQIGALRGNTLRFGEIELMGFRVDPERLNPDQEPVLSLCWRADPGDERRPVPYGVAVTLADTGAEAVARRETYPGLGSYTFWYPDLAFCDRFPIYWTDTALKQGRGYRLAVSLIHPQTLIVRNDDADRIFAGWIASPGPPLAAGRSYRYAFDAELYLLARSVAVGDGSVRVRLEWGTGDWDARALTRFLQITGPDDNTKLLVQDDTLLGEDIYPAFLWGPQERTYSSETILDIPPNIPPGRYCLRLGLYDPETLERASVQDASGQSQLNDIVELSCWRWS